MNALGPAKTTFDCGALSGAACGVAAAYEPGIVRSARLEARSASILAGLL
jgi:hypothetical protein